MYAVGCYYEQQGDDIYNAVALFGRRGEHIGTYHKVHLPIEEKEVAKPGGGYPVFQTDFGLVGAIVCLDIHFPEATRCLALDGAEIIFWPTMYSEPRESITNVLLRARAIENNLFMVASNYSQKRGIHIGFSAIVDTYGEILANTGRREGVATAVINLDDKLAVPGCNDWKTSRAVDSYQRITLRESAGCVSGRPFAACCGSVSATRRRGFGSFMRAIRGSKGPIRSLSCSPRHRRSSDPGDPPFVFGERGASSRCRAVVSPGTLCDGWMWSLTRLAMLPQDVRGAVAIDDELHRGIRDASLSSSRSG